MRSPMSRIGWLRLGKLPHEYSPSAKTSFLGQIEPTGTEWGYRAGWACKSAGTAISEHHQFAAGLGTSRSASIVLPADDEQKKIIDTPRRASAACHEPSRRRDQGRFRDCFHEPNDATTGNGRRQSTAEAAG